MKKLLIAIDGNSGSGKTTLSRHLSEKYGLRFVDSGTIYNYAVYQLLAAGKVNPSDVHKGDLAFLDQTTISQDASLSFRGERFDEERVCTDAVIDNVAYFSQIPFLREMINQLIYRTVADRPAVVDGRDIGTVVFPDAPIKLYTTVSLTTRIKGWRHMLNEQFGRVPQDRLQALIDNAELRDTEDRTRKIAPLTCAPDAVCLSADELSIHEIIERADALVEQWIRANLNRPVLSILIPTYNRSAILAVCLDKLRSFHSSLIEFVVSDDNSADDTLKFLQTIHDPRLSVYHNDRNGGASYNSHLSFLRAKGKYALLISDEDDLIESEIDHLIARFLWEDDISVYIAGGIRGENDLKQFPNREYPNGFSALWQLGYCTRYMTGVIFYTDLYRSKIGEVSYEDAPKVFSVYSFMYAMAELFFEGRVITSDALIFRESRFTATTLTNNDKSTPDIFYFEPKGRESQIRCSVRSLAHLPLNSEQKMLMLVKIYYDSCDAALRIFDKTQQLRYQAMIPQYYERFLEHIAEFTPDMVMKNLKCALISAAVFEGICTREEFQLFAETNEEAIIFATSREKKLAEKLRQTNYYGNDEQYSN